MNFFLTVSKTILINETTKLIPPKFKTCFFCEMDWMFNGCKIALQKQSVELFSETLSLT